MFDEARAVTVALPAVGAFVWPLPSVAPLVSCQVGAQAEGFLTAEALVGFLPSVGPLVDDEDGSPAETLPALWTPEGLLSRVDLVDGQIPPHAEVLPAGGTLEGVVHTVGGLVCQQV